jgi:ferredoxin
LNALRRDFSACSGCSLCLLVCPVWRRTRDPRMTPEGRAKALQNGAAAADIAASVQACILCAACEPVCPEEIDLVGMTLSLRRQLAEAAAPQAALREPSAPQRGAQLMLLPGAGLRASPATLARIQALVGGSVCADDGADIALALEAGADVPAPRLEPFLEPLRAAHRILVEDGLWLRHLRVWLPDARVSGMGEALSRLAAVRRGLNADDLYVIEPRAYHMDYQRLVKYYDELRAAYSCAFNLDLQRIAIPANDAAQAEWILKGRRIARIVVESLQDRAVFEQSSNAPVVHISELAEHATR